MRIAISIFLALILGGCAHSTAREKSRPVSVKPDVVKVSKPVAETKRSVESANVQVARAREATEAARVIAAKTAEAAAIGKELDNVEASLSATQSDLSQAIEHNQEAETAVAVLSSQIEQQTVELAAISEERNAIAEEKRKAEISLVGSKIRESLLWKFLFSIGLLALVEGVVIYFAFKPRFL